MTTTVPINEDAALAGTHGMTGGDAILAPLRDDTTQEESTVETPSTTRSRERRRRKARGSFYSRRRRSSGTSGSANRRGSGASDRRGSGASSAGGGDATRTTNGSRRNRKFASRLGRSRSSFVDRINHAVAEFLNLDAGVNDDEGDRAAGTGALKTSTRRIRRARNPSATGGGTHRRKFGSLLGRSRISYEERLDVAVARSIRELQVENINFDDDEDDAEDNHITKNIEGDRAAGAAEVHVGKTEENRISTATTIRVEDSDEE